METWLTYLAAFLLAGATAVAFPSSTVVLGAMNYLTAVLTSVAVFLFIPISFITFTSGVASLRKDGIGRKVLLSDILWGVVTTLVLASLALAVFLFTKTSFPVTASAGGEYVSLYNEYTETLDVLGVMGWMNNLFLPLLLFAFILGSALTPSADIIRPAYTVINSFSEVMYRIERTISYFGSFYVYVAGTAFFINLWQEKTFFVSPSFFLSILIPAAALIVIVLPLLYAIFTGFKRNPYSVIGRGFSTILFAFVSGNIYASALQSEAINRCSLGVQKRIVSTTTPLGIIINRGGTCFVSTITVLAILKSLGAEVSAGALAVIALTTAVLSFISFLSASSEVAVVTILLFKLLNINVYGAEAAVISILPFLNGIAAAVDITLISLGENITAKRTKTDITVPLKDSI